MPGKSWQLVTGQSLGVAEGKRNAISFDGNQDWLACLTPVLSSATAVNADALAFGDTTVGAWTGTGATT